MADRQWYTAIGGKQEGPFSDQRLRELIAAGSVRTDTLVWCDGMSNWARAAEIPGLLSSASGAVQQPVRPRAAAPAGVAGGPVSVPDDRRLVFDPQQPFDRVWPLFWLVLVMGLSYLVIIPLPWAAPWFLRWFVEHIELPDRQRVSFEGKPGDIWYVFVAYGLCIYLSVGISLAFNTIGSLAFKVIGSLLLLPLTAFLALLITRWFYANLVWAGRTAPLKFTGSYWGLLGWSILASLPFIVLELAGSYSVVLGLPVLALLALVVIVGLAWIYAAWGRWMCRNVAGMRRQFVFTATVWGYLWRTLTFILTGYVLVPWVLRWYVRWLIAQFALIDELAPRA